MNRDNFTIIIADDDEDDHIICQQALKDTGYKHSLAIVKNGSGFFDLISGKNNGGFQTIKPDFVMLDINMPVMDGLEVLEKMKEQDLLEETPVYILTTSRNNKHKEKALKLGAKKYYTKPNSIREFEQIFKEIISTL